MGKQIMIYAESKFFDWSEVAICDRVDNLDINIVSLILEKMKLSWICDGSVLIPLDSLLVHKRDALAVFPVVDCGPVMMEDKLIILSIRYVEATCRGSDNCYLPVCADGDLAADVEERAVESFGLELVAAEQNVGHIVFLAVQLPSRPAQHSQHRLQL